MKRKVTISLNATLYEKAKACHINVSEMATQGIEKRLEVITNAGGIYDKN